jgi:hypothetical protein
MSIMKHESRVRPPRCYVRYTIEAPAGGVDESSVNLNKKYLHLLKILCGWLVGGIKSSQGSLFVRIAAITLSMLETLVSLVGDFHVAFPTRIML